MDWSRDAGARAALGLGVLLGAYAVYAMTTTIPGQLAANYEVYYYAAGAVLDGQGFYGVTPPDHPGYAYLYPPATVLVFVPYAVVGTVLPGYAVHTLTGVGSGVALGVLLARFVERGGHPLTRVDRALVVGFTAASVHAVPSLFYGNVNVQLACLLGAGLVALERGREVLAGALLAVPALFKLFPALLGLWLLRRRAWRAVAAAVGTGAAALVVGTAAFGPDAHRTYLLDALLPRRRTDVFAGGLHPDAPYLTLRRPLSHLFPEHPEVLGPVAALVLTPVVVYAALDVSTLLDRLVAVYAVLAATLLALPSYLVYYVYLAAPLVALLYLLPGGPGRLFAAGTAVAAFAYGRDVVLAALRTLPSGVDGALVAVVRTVLAVGTPTLYGTVLTLVACVWYRYQRRGGRVDPPA